MADGSSRRLSAADAVALQAEMHAYKVCGMAASAAASCCMAWRSAARQTAPSSSYPPAVAAPRMQRAMQAAQEEAAAAKSLAAEAHAEAETLKSAMQVRGGARSTCNCWQAGRHAWSRAT